MDVKTVQKDIDARQLKQVYLLYGEERYLVTHYAAALGEGLDKDVFDGAAPVAQIILAADAFPFMAHKRAVYVRDSRLFATGRKADTEQMADYLTKIPEETVLIFIESDVDKRTRLYKKTAELGRAIDCAPLSPPELSRWVAKQFGKKDKSISPAAAEQLTRSAAHSMTALEGEIAKLAAYVGTRPGITPEDITALCTPTLQTRIFDLLAAMGKGKAGQALSLYANMLHMKEQPLMILAMLIRQFRILLLCKCANEKKHTKPQMAKAFGLRPFMVDEALTQARRYTTTRLLHALADCQDTDLRIKTGRVDGAMGVELLIVKYVD
ncbi:MAG: DNA polymerase III subunit delta [Defluviitaleaceae bacterium]|nr:DNA polymerase III subunit delta [Defluviitaleaceae bacterium]MCL2239632.1 DNA polymerase III subunit delta [Defluviitaleaceae bacterium]